MIRALVAAVAPSLTAAAAALAACSTGSGGPPQQASACDTTFDTNCDVAVPSWSQDVEPLVQKYCANCHTDGGAGMSLFNATSYATVHSGAATMATWVNNCMMPLLDATPPQAYPTDEERQTILSWIACGAPKN